MARLNGTIKRPWFAIGWFAFWGLFQGFIVASVLAGTWERPPAFPQEAYETLIYPDMFFIPLYLLTATLLYWRHWLGSVSAFVAGGLIQQRIEFVDQLGETRERGFDVLDLDLGRIGAGARQLFEDPRADQPRQKRENCQNHQQFQQRKACLQRSGTT